jgi:hypothetical protein
MITITDFNFATVPASPGVIQAQIAIPFDDAKDGEPETLTAPIQGSSEYEVQLTVQVVKIPAQAQQSAGAGAAAAGAAPATTGS